MLVVRRDNRVLPGPVWCLNTPQPLESSLRVPVLLAVHSLSWMGTRNESFDSCAW